MKKIITGIMLCGLVSSSYVDAAVENQTAAGIGVGGLFIGVVVTLTWDKITGKSKRREIAKDKLQELKAKHEDENLEQSLEEIEADELKLNEACPNLTEECAEDKAAVEKILKNKKDKLIDLEHTAKRKQKENEFVERLKKRYEAEFDLAQKAQKDDKASTSIKFERFALENYGGTNIKPFSFYFDTMYGDVQSLDSIRPEDLSAENLAWYQGALQCLPDMLKFISAEFHEKIEKEQKAQQLAAHELRMNEQEYLLKKKEIEAKEAEKQYLVHQDKRYEQMIKANDQNMNLILSKLNALEEQNNRGEDQRGGIVRQLWSISKKIDESHNANEVHDQSVHDRFNEIDARFEDHSQNEKVTDTKLNNLTVIAATLMQKVSELSAGFGQVHASQLQQINDYHNQQAQQYYVSSPYASQPSAPYNGK